MSAQFIIYASCHVSNLTAEAAILSYPPHSLHSAYLLLIQQRLAVASKSSTTPSPSSNCQTTRRHHRNHTHSLPLPLPILTTATLFNHIHPILLKGNCHLTYIITNHSLPIPTTPHILLQTVLYLYLYQSLPQHIYY